MYDISRSLSLNTAGRKLGLWHDRRVLTLLGRRCRRVLAAVGHILARALLLERSLAPRRAAGGRRSRGLVGSCLGVSKGRLLGLLWWIDGRI